MRSGNLIARQRSVAKASRRRFEHYGRHVGPSRASKCSATSSQVDGGSRDAGDLRHSGPGEFRTLEQAPTRVELLPIVSRGLKSWLRGRDLKRSANSSILRRLDRKSVV